MFWGKPVSRLLADSRLTDGRQLANKWPTVGQQTADSQPTGFLGSSSSQLPKYVFTILTNRMDRQTVVTPSLEKQVIYINFPLTRYNFPIVYGPKTAFYDLPNDTDR